MYAADGRAGAANRATRQAGGYPLVMRRTLTMLAAVALIASCGGGGNGNGGDLGGTLSMKTLTDENADQACETLFGKSADLGKLFSEADYTWEGGQFNQARLSCRLTQVGSSFNDTPLSFSVELDESTGQFTFTSGSEDGKALSDTVKKRSAELIESAKKRVTA